MSDFVTIVHECKDFTAWKKVYDADRPRRTSAGLTELNVLRDLDKPNLVALMFEASDIARARDMSASPELAAKMASAGVIGAPRVRFREGAYAHRKADIYATITADVRDFATAMKAYAMDAADRKAAGLTDLGVLQLKDDPRNILLLWSVADVTRARAFFDSPSLAEHMTRNAGVVSRPERHFWRI